MSKLHNLELNTEFAEAVLNGEKNFELRFNDRGFQKGDRVKFTVINEGCVNPYHPLGKKTYVITYVINGWGLENGFVAFDIKEVSDE